MKLTEHEKYDKNNNKYIKYVYMILSQHETAS